MGTSAQISYVPDHGITYNIACAPSEESCQPAHPRNLKVLPLSLVTFALVTVVVVRIFNATRHPRHKEAATCICTALLSWITLAHLVPLSVTKRRPVHFILNPGGGRVVRRCCVSYITGASN